MAYPKAITEASFLTLDKAETPVSNIKKLPAGRVDLMIGAKAVTRDVALCPDGAYFISYFRLLVILS